MFDKIYKEGYSREEQIEAFRRSVAIQRKQRGNSGNRYCFITDGTNVKKVDPDLPIPQGWWRGVPRKKQRGIK